MCSKKQPWRETVCEPWLLIAFPFPDCDSLKEIPQGLKIPVIFIISTTIKKINMTQGNARFCNKKFQWEHRAKVVTYTKFGFSMQLTKAAVKMVSCLCCNKFPGGYVSFCNLEGTSKHSWGMWYNGTDGIRASNTKYQFLDEDTFAIISSHCPLLSMYVLLEGRGCLSAVGMGEPMPSFSSLGSPFSYLKSHYDPAHPCWWGLVFLVNRHLSTKYEFNDCGFIEGEGCVALICVS